MCVCGGNDVHIESIPSSQTNADSRSSPNCLCRRPYVSQSVRRLSQPHPDQQGQQLHSRAEIHTRINIGSGPGWPWVIPGRLQLKSKGGGRRSLAARITMFVRCASRPRLRAPRWIQQGCGWTCDAELGCDWSELSVEQSRRMNKGHQGITGESPGKILTREDFGGSGEQPGQAAAGRGSRLHCLVMTTDDLDSSHLPTHLLLTLSSRLVTPQSHCHSHFRRNTRTCSSTDIAPPLVL